MPKKSVVFLDKLYRTSPSHVHDLLSDYLVQHPTDDSVLGHLEVDQPITESHHTVYTIAMGRFGLAGNLYYGAIGFVDVIPANDIEAVVRISSYSGSLTLYDKDGSAYEVPTTTWTAAEDKLVSAETESLLLKLAAYFENVLGHVSRAPGAAASSRHAGRYRLTSNDIEYRKGIVKHANEIRQADPAMPWKQIAAQLGFPERTLRDWRHNPLYQ